MAEVVTKLPIKTDTKGAELTTQSRPGTLMNLRREIDRLFDSFRSDWRLPLGHAFDIAPLFSRESAFAVAPAVDVVEKEKAYELSAELPGMDDKNIEVKLAGGTLTIKGEKKEEKEEKEKDYYLSERSYGAFQRAFVVPDGVDQDKIEASFSKGVLTVTLPKTAEAQKAEKKISIKAA